MFHQTITLLNSFILLVYRKINKYTYGTSEYYTTEKSGLEVEENKLGN
jgi:hypothetical protein